MARKRARPDGRRTLVIGKREVIRFPVPRNHRYAKFQTLKRITSTEHVRDFLSLWSARAAQREQPLPEDAAIVAALRKQRKRVFVLNANDLVVPKGATVVLTDPLNELQFDSISLQGDLVCHGDIVIRCQNLS